MSKETVSYLDETCWITLEKHPEDMYTIETPSGIFKGYYKKLSERTYKVKLNLWFSKETKRFRGKSNKLFKETEQWFAHIINEASK